MDWEAAAERAVAQRAAKASATGNRAIIVRLRAWSKRRKEARSFTAPEPGYYVHSSDWPITRSDQDVPPEKTMQSLRGLSNYYGAAIATLANDARQASQDG